MFCFHLLLEIKTNTLLSYPLTTDMAFQPILSINEDPLIQGSNHKLVVSLLTMFLVMRHSHHCLARSKVFQVYDAVGSMVAFQKFAF